MLTCCSAIAPVVRYTLVADGVVRQAWAPGPTSIGTDVRRQVDLVDDEQVRARDARSALARDLLPLRHVDDVDRRVDELGTEGGGQVVAAALHQQQVKRRESPQQLADGFEVDGRVLADRGVRTAARLDADDALGRERAAPGEELG